MSNPTHIPPGWYKDPTARNQVRWWDGTGWGQEVAPEKAPVVAMAPAPRVPKRRLTAAERKRQNRTWLVLGVLAMVLVIGATVLEGSTEEDDNPSTAGGLDASAQLACSDFGSVARGASAGIMTDAELREELKDIHDDAQYSDSPGIASAAQSMLAAATSGSGFEASVAAMTTACTGEAPTPPRMAGVSFSSCSEAERLGAAPMAKDHPDYRGYLDRDNNGVACDE